jgi:hypothetical protein
VHLRVIRVGLHQEGRPVELHGGVVILPLNLVVMHSHR